MSKFLSRVILAVRILKLVLRVANQLVDMADRFVEQMNGKQVA